MSAALRLAVFAASDKGRVREGNEDNLFAGRTVFAVADGMGGHVAGEIASEVALRPIEELDGRRFADARSATEALRRAIEAANAGVIAEARANPDHAGMGTTLTAVLARDEVLHVGHVGDSRAYLLRPGQRIEQLTTDHTLVEELVQEGRLAREDAGTHPQRSVITRAIGVDDHVDVDTLPPLVLQPGDQVLLCSDGLTGPVDNDEIAAILDGTEDGDEAVRRLVATANEHGGPDNITVVLLRAEGGDATAVTAEADGDGDTLPTAPPEAAASRSIPIRTRPQPTGHDFATDFRRFGLGRKGGNQRFGGEPGERGRGRRVLAVVFSVLVLVAILGAGGWVLLTRAWFLGVDDGHVAIYNGLPDAVAGVELHWLHETTDIAVAELDPHIAQRLDDGIVQGSLAEAQATVQAYQAEIDAALPAQGPPAQPERRRRAQPTERPAERQTP